MKIAVSHSPSLWIKFKQHTNWWVLGFIIVFSFWLMVSGFQYQDYQIIVGGKAFSDFAAHIPLIRSFSMGNNLPPEYPLFAGQPIRYHFLFYWLVAMLEKTGLNIALSLNLLSVIGFSLLLWMIYQVAVLFFASKKIGILALYLFLFNGSLSFIKFFTDHPLSSYSFFDVVSAPHFASFGPWGDDLVSAFWNLNIYTNQRHLGLSFGLILLLVWPALKSSFSKRYQLGWWQLLLMIVGISVFPLLHQAGYVMLVALIMLWLVFNPQISLRLVKTYAIGMIISIAVFGWFTQGRTQVISWQLGFLASNDEFETIIKYWFYNLGIYLPLIPIVLLLLKGRAKLFILFSYSFFVLANLFQLSTDMINNHKLINFFMITMNIGVAGMLVKSWTRGMLSKIGVVVVIFFLTLSGWIDFFPIYNDNLYYIDDYQRSDIMTWVNQQTLRDSVFLTTSYLYNPVSLVGRKTFLDYGYFAWSLGYPDGERRIQLTQLFGANIKQIKLCGLIKQHGLDYLLVSPGDHQLGDKINIEQSVMIKDNRPTYVSQDGYQVYDLDEWCRQSHPI